MARLADVVRQSPDRRQVGGLQQAQGVLLAQALAVHHLVAHGGEAGSFQGAVREVGHHR